MSYDFLERLMSELDTIREELTEKLEYTRTEEEEDVISGVITNLSESIDDIGLYLSEADL